MVSRRDMLRISAGVAAGSLVSAVPTIDAQERPERALAPSIQALKSLRRRNARSVHWRRQSMR